MHSEEIEVSGYVENIIFSNEDNGYYVLGVVLKQEKGKTVVTINKLNIKKGLTLKFTGNWVETPKFGKQFKATKAEEITPDSSEGIIAWISSDYFKGIGQVTAQRMVDYFGIDKIIDVFNNDIDRLLEIRGITKKKLVGIKQSWEENKQVNEIMIFLQNNGISTLYSVKIHKTYGQDCIKIIQDNP